jgi:hypothetical protein
MENQLLEHKWNIIEEDEFKKRIENVFKRVSDALTKTLGPFGNTTIIEKMGEMYITKDGWQVLKNLRSSDQIDNNIMQLLIRIAAQVVIKVGDGSTSSIEAANSILEKLQKAKIIKEIRSKDLKELIEKCVNMISNKILEKSIKIDKNGDYNEIFKLALISTNGNKEISEIIQTIYKLTNNPSIEFIQSKTNKTSLEIVEGYKLGITYLDSIFANSDDGICKVYNPLILMFDHKIGLEKGYKIILMGIQKALERNTKLIVVAPYYDKLLMEKIKTITTGEYRTRGETTTIYTRISLINNISYELYNDFSIMTGGMIIKENDLDDIINEHLISLDDFIGEVNNISINDKTTLIQGFNKRNIDMYNKVLNDAANKYREFEEKCKELDIVNSELYDLKQRISKLNCNMGVIHVGGNSSLEKASTYDLVEDGVKACESAYKYGYNLGGNLIIPICIKEILNTNELSSNEKIILHLLELAFKEVFFKVINNMYKNNNENDHTSEINSIIDSCIKQHKCYDLIKLEYSDNIINPCYTDIEILKAATSIVSLLISSNQYISIMIE